MVTKSNWNSLPGVEIWHGAVVRQVFSGKNSMMVMNRITPAARPALHSHPHEQLSYILEGKCKFVLGDEIFDLVEGDVILIPPDVPHSLEVTGDKNVLNLDVFSPIREDYLPANPGR